MKKKASDGSTMEGIVCAFAKLVSSLFGRTTLNWSQYMMLIGQMLSSRNTCSENSFQLCLDKAVGLYRGFAFEIAA